MFYYFSQQIWWKVNSKAIFLIVRWPIRWTISHWAGGRLKCRLALIAHLGNSIKYENNLNNWLRDQVSERMLEIINFRRNHNSPLHKKWIAHHRVYQSGLASAKQTHCRWTETRIVISVAETSQNDSPNPCRLVWSNPFTFFVSPWKWSGNTQKETVTTSIKVERSKFSWSVPLSVFSDLETVGCWLWCVSWGWEVCLINPSVIVSCCPQRNIPAAGGTMAVCITWDNQLQSFLRDPFN